MFTFVITLIVVLILCVILYYMFIGMPLTMIYMTRENKQTKREAEELEAHDAVSCQHFDGLPVKRNERCRIFFLQDKVIIKALKQDLNIEIPFEKVGSIFLDKKRGVNTLNIVATDHKGVTHKMIFFDGFNNSKLKKIVKRVNKDYVGLNKTIKF